MTILQLIDYDYPINIINKQTDHHDQSVYLTLQDTYKLAGLPQNNNAKNIITLLLQPIPGGARIDVSINELYDGSYTGSPHDLIAAQGRAGGAAAGGPRAGPTRRTSLTHVLVWRARARRRPTRHSLAEFLELDDADIVDAQRPYLTGHNRWTFFCYDIAISFTF